MSRTPTLFAIDTPGVVSLAFDPRFLYPPYYLQPRGR